MFFLWVSREFEHSPYPPGPLPLGITGSLALPIPARDAASGYRRGFTAPHTRLGRHLWVPQGFTAPHTRPNRCFWVSRALWHSTYPHRPLPLGTTGASPLPIPAQTAAFGYHRLSGTPHTHAGRCLWVSQGLWHSLSPLGALLLGITGALALPIPARGATSGYHGLSGTPHTLPGHRLWVPRGFGTPYTRTGHRLWVSQGLHRSPYPPKPLLLGTTGSLTLPIPAPATASGYRRGFTAPHTRPGRRFWVPRMLGHSPYPPRPPPLGITGSLALYIPAQTAASGYHHHSFLPIPTDCNFSIVCNRYRNCAIILGTKI